MKYTKKTRAQWKRDGGSPALKVRPKLRGTITGRRSSFIVTDDLAQKLMSSGLYGGPSVHPSHPDAICVAVNPHVYECPTCHSRDLGLALPCPKASPSP